MKPVVDQLEEGACDRFRIIRLDVCDELGQSLMAEYGATFSPTFVLVGRVLRELEGT